ncbi:MAG: hypothetical protein WBB39_00260 [Candidatus Saccharimonadales bacterium]
MSRGSWQLIGVTAACLCLLAWPMSTHAQTLASPNYRFDESTLGAGGVVQSGSTNFSVTSGAGDIGVGNSTSTNFQINSGSNTPRDPFLTFTMLSSNANFGTLSATTTSTATATFAVSNYTSYGYVVQIYGSPPTNATHTLTPMTSTGPSQVGIEQFGINLVANTSPASFGANPNNGQFGYGAIMSNYATPNEFRYNSGETIAHADKSSGQTIYTLSYIVNVTPLTAGGQYSTDQTIIVTGTY